MPATVTLEHYEVLTREDGTLHELGRGAMGITYKGYDTRLRVPVALKVINTAHLHSDSARQRFVREARAAAQLRHRNVASVFHLGEDEGNYFYVMEFIDGETVDALVRRQGHLAPAFALRIAAQVARALNAAQTHDLVHRDIKPANLMAVVEDDELVIKVIDFGLAKIIFGDGERTMESLTHGGLLGTPHFASPEQLEEREIDVRSDIYSLGITLWFLLTGTTPFRGSVARVIGQHLSKAAPFEELTDLPAAIVDLLRRMLAKNPAERPQTPANLRKEIEACLKGLVESETPAVGKALPASPTRASPPSGPEETRYETGLTIAHRYLLTEDLGESEAGTTFLARDLQRKREVRVLILHRELLADLDIMDRITREADAVNALAHPNILVVEGPMDLGRNAFFTLEAIDGFSLRQVLRSRRELRPVEVSQLLTAAAGGLDEALQRLPRLELGLHHVQLHFPNRQVPVEELLQRRTPDWPEFVVKLNPLATWRELFALTWTAGQTLVGGGASQHRPTEARATAFQALGGIAYELLGGVAAGYGTSGYSPLAALDEATNAVLQRALVSPESFSSATELMQQFTTAPAIGLAPRVEPVPIPIPPPPEKPPEAATLPPPPAASLPESPVPAIVEPARYRSALGLAAGVLIAGLAAYAVLHFRHQHNPPPPAEPTPFPTPQLSQATPPAATPTPTTPKVVAHLATPPPATPIPLTPPPATPIPIPTRPELASAARRAAEVFEARQKSKEALGAWLRMAKDFPEFDTGRLGVEMLLTRLRRRPGGLTPAEFTAMNPDLRQAAQLGISAAMLTLGEELRQSSPREAFGWYCAAASSGEPLAMTQAGLMLSNGNGTPKDMTKAFSYFQAAAEKGNTYAKNRLGWCYHKGIGTKANGREAFRLFGEAAESGSIQAITNLGVLYMTGEGVEKNTTKAAEKFKEASAKGDVEGMYCYAGCLDGGLGVKTDAGAARKWFQSAANAGHTGAIEWCKAHNAPFKPRP